MINLENLKYARPDLKKLIEDFKILLEDFSSSNSFREANNLFIRINSLRSEFITLEKKCRILGINDNGEEISFFDENTPIYREVETIFFQSLLDSKFKKELEQVWGSHIFNIALGKVKTFDKSIREDLVKENKLVSHYHFVLDQAKKLIPPESIVFNNQWDWEERKKIQTRYRDFYLDLEDDLSKIFMDLVSTRTKMAQKLGFKNYLDLGNLRHKRVDYFSQNINDFSQGMLPSLQAIHQHLIQLQKTRLATDKIYYHNESLVFPQANPRVSLDTNGILNVLRIFFGQLSLETGEYIEFMVANDLIRLDLDQEGLTYLNHSKTPLLSLNYQHDFEDLKKLFNMLGQSIHYYMSSEYDIPEYSEMTTETKSAISKSMEYMGYSGLSLVLGDDLNKYIYWHISQNIGQAIYNLMVDEFEFRVYKNYNMTYKEMKLLWRELELKYFPERIYEDDYLGSYWLDNPSVFEKPLSAIGDVIGQNITEKIVEKICSDREDAIGKYLKVCKTGASKSLYEIMELSNIKHPLENFPNVDSIIASIDNINSKIGASNKTQLEDKI